jgi:hypothetical protein
MIGPKVPRHGYQILAVATAVTLMQLQQVR